LALWLHKELCPHVKAAMAAHDEWGLRTLDYGNNLNKGTKANCTPGNDGRSKTNRHLKKGEAVKRSAAGPERNVDQTGSWWFTVQWEFLC